MSELIKPRVKFHRIILLFPGLTLAVLVYLNFYRRSLLKVDPSIAHDYGWPIPIFKRGLTLDSDIQIQAIAVVGNFAIGFLIIYAVWWISRKIVEHRNS